MDTEKNMYPQPSQDGSQALPPFCKGFGALPPHLQLAAHRRARINLARTGIFVAIWLEATFSVFREAIRASYTIFQSLILQDAVVQSNFNTTATATEIEKSDATAAALSGGKRILITAIGTISIMIAVLSFILFVLRPLGKTSRHLFWEGVLACFFTFQATIGGLLGALRVFGGLPGVWSSLAATLAYTMELILTIFATLSFLIEAEYTGFEK